MEDYDSRLDLAPRDIVARAIQDQMLSRNDGHVLLDIRCSCPACLMEGNTPAAIVLLLLLWKSFQRSSIVLENWHYGVCCSYKPADEILAHFPNIAAQCKTFGIDITREPIPVAPAQHYMCGGVQVKILYAHLAPNNSAIDLIFLICIHLSSDPADGGGQAAQGMALTC